MKLLSNYYQTHEIQNQTFTSDCFLSTQTNTSDTILTSEFKLKRSEEGPAFYSVTLKCKVMQSKHYESLRK